MASRENIAVHKKLQRFCDTLTRNFKFRYFTKLDF